MDRRYINMILKPYKENGLQYTDVYKKYGLENAAVITGDDDVDALKRSDMRIESAVVIDVCDFSFLYEMKYIDKLSVVFTEKSKVVDIEPIYASGASTFLLSGPRNIKSIDLKKMPKLSRLKISKSLIDLNCAVPNLTALELSDVGTTGELDFSASFPHLENLILSDCVIENFDFLSGNNQLRSLSIERSTVNGCKGFGRLEKLKRFYFGGELNADIISELRHCADLEYLGLDCYAEITDVEWVKELPRLKALILGCVIKSCDLSPLKDIPFVRVKSDSDRYNLHDKDLSKDTSYIVPSEISFFADRENLS